ncbi:MAG: SDR family NAD(P)-dependent oxidoreductase [Mycobacteriales bacterium]
MNALDRFKLTGRRAIVTGGNRGLGRAFATALADAGATVAILARDVDRTARAVEELRAAGAAAIGIDVDLMSKDAVVQAIQSATEQMEGLDVLVNNAGACVHAPAFEVTDEDWNAVFDLNVRSLWWCAREAARIMRTTGGGSIVNIGSISAAIVNRPQMQPAYNASKAAVHQLTRSLAVEWAPHNIRVNALAPGYVHTDMAPVDRPEFRARWIDDVPMRRAADPDEIAPAVVYLASDASSFATGTVLTVDGGYTAV